jgi:hypothetical protein
MIIQSPLENSHQID